MHKSRLAVLGIVLLAGLPAAAQESIVPKPSRTRDRHDTVWAISRTSDNAPPAVNALNLPPAGAPTPANQPGLIVPPAAPPLPPVNGHAVPPPVNGHGGNCDCNGKCSGMINRACLRRVLDWLCYQPIRGCCNQHGSCGC